MTITFEEARPVETDDVPELENVEYPCDVCGREAGPYSGRGPHPKKCTEHKRVSAKGTRSPRVTGNVANMAAQATGVLVQLNGIMAIGLMAVGMNGTASALAAGNDIFEQQAYAALMTDPDLCKLILKGGVKSAKISLAMAYGTLGFSVMPTAMAEVKEKREIRAARKAEEEEAS